MSQPAGNTAVARPSAPRSQPLRSSAGKIESKQFAEQSSGPDDHLFELLDGKQIGIDFYHKWNEQLGQNRNTATGSGVTMGDYDGDGRVEVARWSWGGGGR